MNNRDRRRIAALERADYELHARICEEAASKLIGVIAERVAFGRHEGEDSVEELARMKDAAKEFIIRGRECRRSLEFAAAADEELYQQRVARGEV